MGGRPKSARLARASGASPGAALLFAAVAAAFLVLPAILLRVPAAPRPAAGVAPPSARAAPSREQPLVEIISRPGDLPPAHTPGDTPPHSEPELAAAIDPLPHDRPQPPSRPAPPGAAARPGPIVERPPAHADGAHAAERRREERRAALRRFGGSPETQDAVEIALAWLVAHQDEDGGWNRFTFDRHCPRGETCPGRALRRRDDSLRVGLTGLVLLALLGAGYADDDGPYRESVGRGLAFLLKAQAADGAFLGDEAMAGYNNSLATLALAEYLALTGNDRVRPSVTAAVSKLAATQQPLGGWDYLARSDTGRNDTSITGWAVQALLSASAAGVPVPPETLIRANLHFQRAAQLDGRVWYSDSGTGFEIDMRTMRPAPRYGPAMGAVGLASEVLLGWRTDAATPRVQRTWLLGQPPSQFTMQRDPTELHDYYYWYYGSLAFFQCGGDDWDRWNAALRDALLPLQDRRERAGGGGRAHTYGSWPPYGQGWGKWGRMGGRVYSTAIAALTLEVYYRHPPAYLEPALAVSPAGWRDFLAACDPRERRSAIGILAQTRVEVAEPVLVQLLEGPPQPAGRPRPPEDARVAPAAAIALAELGSPRGAGVLRDALEELPAWERAKAEAALQAIERRRAAPPPAGTIRHVDAAAGLVTADVPGAYLGLELVIRRDEVELGRARILQRFTGRDTVVAEVLNGRAGALRIGDAAQGSAW